MVGPIRVDGLASGIDYTSIIEKLMAIQKAPIVRFQGRVAEITERAMRGELDFAEARDAREARRGAAQP